MIKTVLAYDIEPGVTPEEYERWLFDVHVPDIMANPHVSKLVFNRVLRPVGTVSGGDMAIDSGALPYRVAEMHFEDEAAYQRYRDWFDEHPIPVERGPQGRTAFRFYVVTDSVSVDRSQPLGPSFLDGGGPGA